MNTRRTPREPIRVLIASPGDVAEERDVAERVIANINVSAGDRPYDLEAVRWERVAVPTVAADGQLAVKPYVDGCDIVVCIFWSRLGTPTERAESGSAEELLDALTGHKANGLPKLMSYRCTRGFPSTVDAEQLSRLNDFQQRTKGLGVFWGDYETPGQLYELLREHLADVAGQTYDLIAVRQQSPDEYPDDQKRDRRDDSADLIDLRLALEQRLAWLAKHLLGGPASTTFVTIGSMEYDGYLTREQARVATRVLTGLVPTGTASEREAFLDTARRLINTFRVGVFEAHVRKELERSSAWRVEPFGWSDRNRPDFIARNGDRAFRITPRISAGPDARVLAQVRRRLASATDDPPGVERRLIVVPDMANDSLVTEQPTVNPQVVRQADLLATLDA